MTQAACSWATSGGVAERSIGPVDGPDSRIADLASFRVVSDPIHRRVVGCGEHPGRVGLVVGQVGDQAEQLGSVLRVRAVLARSCSSGAGPAASRQVHATAGVGTRYRRCHGTSGRSPSKAAIASA